MPNPMPCIFAYYFLLGFSRLSVLISRSMVYYELLFGYGLRIFVYGVISYAYVCSVVPALFIEKTIL